MKMRLKFTAIHIAILYQAAAALEITKTSISDWACVFAPHLMIIRAAVKYTVAFGIYDHVAILAFVAFPDIVQMAPIICHEIAYFRFIGTKPEIQAIAFIELILERVAAIRAPQAKQIDFVHI
jgi:hypothetical protein